MEKDRILSLLLFGFGLCFIFSCQLLKRDKVVLKQQSEQEELSVLGQQQILQQHSQLSVTDSNDTDFELVLWPKGKFSYSLAKGFEGEAEKIRVKGKYVTQKKLVLSKVKQQDNKVLKANYTNKKESNIVIKKNKLSAAYNWGWVLVLLILIVLIWWYSRFK